MVKLACRGPFVSSSKMGCVPAAVDVTAVPGARDGCLWFFTGNVEGKGRVWGDYSRRGLRRKLLGRGG